MDTPIVRYVKRFLEKHGYRVVRSNIIQRMHAQLAIDEFTIQSLADKEEVAHLRNYLVENIARHIGMELLKAGAITLSETEDPCKCVRILRGTVTAFVP